MEQERNIAKYENYKGMHRDLSKAIRQGFCYQAIFIEYAILEDRMASLLKYAGIKYIDKKGRDISMGVKLNRAETHPNLSTQFVRKYITLELIEEVRNWVKQRDDLIHHLANIPYDNERIKSVAEDGQKIVKTVSARVNSVNRYHQKQLGDLK